MWKWLFNKIAENAHVIAWMAGYDPQVATRVTAVLVKRDDVAPATAAAGTSSDGGGGGCNKILRDIGRVLLAVVCICLLMNRFLWLSIVLSALSTLTLRLGSPWSLKNILWLSLSFISFVTSLIAATTLVAYNHLDEEKAYTLSKILWFTGMFVQRVWGGILAMFLISAYCLPLLRRKSNDTPDANTELLDNSNSKLEPAKWSTNECWQIQKSHSIHSRTSSSINFYAVTQLQITKFCKFQAFRAICRPSQRTAIATSEQHCCHSRLTPMPRKSNAAIATTE